jgi:UDP-N-acetylglucosamine 4-epimerase
MSEYETLCGKLSREPRAWLITGVAGFIGSHLLETLLKLDQRVVGLDNFATGRRSNLQDVERAVTSGQWGRFRMVQGDILELDTCRAACAGVDYVLHQAALGSVPRSIEDPIRSHASNVTGFLNMLVAARDVGANRFVYASSSSVYGDEPDPAKVELRTGRPLSPYAATKAMNELYAAVFSRCYALQTIGLRYFNVFGPRQDPNGPYAAVIPKWVGALLTGSPVHIHGDGETSRDFCYVANVVQANLLAATTSNQQALDTAFNVGASGRTSLNELYQLLCRLLFPDSPRAGGRQPVYGPFRPGDVRHSLADISKARALLGYEPSHNIGQGIAVALEWYKSNLP